MLHSNASKYRKIRRKSLTFFRMAGEYGLFIRRQNFRLVQIESICRRQHKCNWKIEICFGKGSKRCGKRRKCWLPSYSGLCGKELIKLYTLFQYETFDPCSVKMGPYKFTKNVSTCIQKLLQLVRFSAYRKTSLPYCSFSLEARLDSLHALMCGIF